MLIAILAVLGIPLWFLGATVLGAILNRRRMARIPGSFKARIRTGDDVPGLPAKWRSGYALWAHDVLVVYRGAAMLRVIPLPVESIEREAAEADPSEVKGLGDRPAKAAVQLDGGQIVELAADEADAGRLAGPLARAGA